MYLAQITFKPDSYDLKRREELADIAECYLVSLLKNGQTWGEYLFGWSGEKLICFTQLPRPNSLDPKFNSEWGTTDLDKVLEAFGSQPECRIISDRVPERFPSWKKSSSFYLFTHAFDDTSPICCGDTERMVPTYLLPISSQTREYLFFWSRSYIHHDRIWFESAALEIPAYKQMADPKSDLSNTGRDLCEEIEKRTGKQTYYFLTRYWGRNECEKSRLCPGCGRKWNTQFASKKSCAFHEFQFCCDPCRLVSHLADSYDDERHARIGEFKKSTKK